MLLPPGGLSTSVNLDRTTKTGGFLSGLDFTFFNFAGGDLLTVGALGRILVGARRVQVDHPDHRVVRAVRRRVPAYVRGPFSADVTFKADFLKQDTSFVDFPGDIFQTSGSSSVDLTVYSIAANANYRIPLGVGRYFEPTAGVIYADFNYDTGAAAFGFADSTATRLHGGARLGVETMWGNIRATTTLTGIAYNYVQVTGGAVAGFIGPGVLPSDEGKTYGQFLLATAYESRRWLDGLYRQRRPLRPRSPRPRNQGRASHSVGRELAIATGPLYFAFESEMILPITASISGGAAASSSMARST